jgi:ABC-type bacteriocin/lantibiotic exporter with double-glycine peptidase domain
MGSFIVQPNSYSCGAVSLVNAARTLGVELSYDDAKRLTGTTARDGVDERGLINAIAEVGLHYHEYTTSNSQNGWRWLLKWSKTTPLILCLDSYQHWSTVTGRIGRKVILVDPRARNGESGVHPIARVDLLERWIYRGKGYAIRVSG